MTTPSPKQLREFITSYFNDSELNQLCSDYFPEVYDDFTIGMLKPNKVLHLLGYCRRRDLTANLLGSLEEERKGAYQKSFAASGKPTKQLPKQKPSSFIHQKTGMEFVRISAGEFKYGENLEVRNLLEYWISRTPVTQAVYQRFIDANPSHRVPSLYWDEKKRMGDSPYGCVDMSGNVWEWCLNKYETPTEITVDDSNARRVLRGGSWYNDLHDARAAYRFNSHPSTRNSNIGFRVLARRFPSQ